jgi:hypothetical protein
MKQSIIMVKQLAHYAEKNMFDKHKVFQLNHLNSKKIDDLDPFISFKSKDEIINYIKHITNGKVSHGFQSCHFGQRKLLLSEIMFILYTHI